MEIAFAKKIDKRDLLFNNLLLLGLEPIAVEKKHRIELNRTCLNQQNSKAVQFILFFLLERIAIEEELISLKLCFPPKNLAEQNEFRTQVYNILKSLEECKKIPKNFIVGKSILEVTHGEKIIHFLRFLSEFCLKNTLEATFSAAKIPFIRINISKSKEIDVRDINEYYSLSSFLDSRASLIKSVSGEKIQEAISSCMWQIRVQQDKFNKRTTYLFELYDKWKKEAEKITGEYYNNKDILLQVYNTQKQLEKTMDKKYFNELRALDRVPQIDMINELYKILKKIHLSVTTKRLEAMINEFNTKAHKNTLSNILEVSSFAGSSKGGKNYFLNELNTKFSDGLENLEARLQERKNDDKTDMFNKQLDSLIERKKRNISHIQQLRNEFIKIV